MLGVRQSDSGVASALVNTSQQVSDSLGIALLNTVAPAAATLLATGATTDQAAALHGCQDALFVSCIVLAVGGLASALFIWLGRQRLPAREHASDSSPRALSGRSSRSS